MSARCATRALGVRSATDTGTVAHNRCPQCSAALRPDAQWCGLCYHDLREAPAPVLPAPSAPARSVPAQFAPARAVPAEVVPAHLVPADLVPDAQLALPLPLQPADSPSADQAGTDAPDGTAPARQAGWPCAICSLLVPLDAEVCPSCGASFFQILQADAARQAPPAGVIMRLPRAARLAAAVVLSLVLAVLVPLLLTLLG
ncbi:MAG: hypothetical protein QOJ32_3222 [Frankiaceae bacterium]|nr:hypothetical protein [Frankiaceae bacterium]